jgi:phosphoserine aminotransferase
MLTMEWIKENGGVEGMKERNEKKSSILYKEIDQNGLFIGHSIKEDRSHMNVTFKLIDEALSEEFDLLCKQNGLDGLKGHRSVGGYRASIYNAMEIEGVERLVETMKEFEKKKG